MGFEALERRRKQQYKQPQQTNTKVVVEDVQSQNINSNNNNAINMNVATDNTNDFVSQSKPDVEVQTTIAPSELKLIGSNIDNSENIYSDSNGKILTLPKNDVLIGYTPDGGEIWEDRNTGKTSIGYSSIQKVRNPEFSPVNHNYNQPQESPKETSIAIVSPKDNPKEYLINRLGLSVSEEIDVLTDAITDADPLDFTVDDTEGKISRRLSEIEAKTGLAVIPFKVAGLHPMIQSIIGYDIIKLDGELYASPIDKVSFNLERVKSFENEWIQILKKGRYVNQSLVTTKMVEGFGEVKTIALNSYEIRWLMGRFRKYGPKPFCTSSDLVFTIGV